jgi:two-component system, NtrC family, sensor kinase
MLDTMVSASDQRWDMDTKFSLFMQHSPIALIEWDACGKVVGWNEAASGIFELDATETIGCWAQEIIRPQDTWQMLSEVWSHAIRSGQGIYSVHCCMTATGKVLTCEWYNTPLIGHAGEYLGVLSQVIDTTERQRLENAIQHSHQFLNKVINGSNEPIFVKDQTGRWILINDSACDFLGKTRADLLDRFDPDILPSEMLESGMTWDRMVLDRTACDMDHEIEIPWCCPQTGQQKSVLVKRSCFEDHTGAKFLVTTICDVTQLKQVEQALQHQNETLEERVKERTCKLQEQTQSLEAAVRQLQNAQLKLIQSEKMSSLGQLVAGVAHEINNPTNFIAGNLRHALQYIQDLLGLVDLYEKHYPEPFEAIAERKIDIDLDFLTQDLTKLLKSMSVGTERIQEIVRSLRIFSRMDEAEVKEVNIHEGIDSTLMILQHRLKASSSRPAIAVNCHYGDVPAIECYAGQLNQVFMNLISNGIDALEEAIGSGQITDPVIDITTELLEKEYISIRISDNGSGIDVGLQNRLFDPFFTTKPVGKGTGMGLSISYQIVTERHKGNLWFASNRGEGTEFVIQIPMKQAYF